MASAAAPSCLHAGAFTTLQGGSQASRQPSSCRGSAQCVQVRRSPVASKKNSWQGWRGSSGGKVGCFRPSSCLLGLAWLGLSELSGWCARSSSCRDSWQANGGGPAAGPAFPEPRRGPSWTSPPRCRRRRQAARRSRARARGGAWWVRTPPCSSWGSRRPRPGSTSRPCWGRCWRPCTCSGSILPQGTERTS